MTFPSFVISVSCLQQDSLGDSALTPLCICFVPTSNQVCSNPSATRRLRGALFSSETAPRRSSGTTNGAPCHLTFLQLPPASPCKPGDSHNANLKQKQMTKKAFDFGILFLNYFKNSYRNLFFVVYNCSVIVVPSLCPLFSDFGILFKNQNWPSLVWLRWLGIVLQSDRLQVWAPSQGMYEGQPINISLSQWCSSPSLFPSFPSF